MTIRDVKHKIYAHLNDILHQEIHGTQTSPIWEGANTPHQKERVLRAVQEVREEFQKRSGNAEPERP